MNITVVKNKFFSFILITFLGFIGCQTALATDVAITVDDLPQSGPLPPNVTRLNIANQMLAVFKKHHIEGVYGMINGTTISNANDQKVLQNWIDDGQLLGNHTYTHLNPNKVSTEQYIADIKRNEPILQKLMGDKNYKYFRYPFLAEGNTPAKRDAIRSYLFSQGYKIAPVTVDFADWSYNPAYARCMKKNNQQAVAWLEKSYYDQSVSALQRAQAMSQALFHRDIKQVLLIHIGAMDAQMLDKVLTAYENHGVAFIPLNVALNDDAYKLTPSFSDTKGFTYLNQIVKMQKIPYPKSVSKLYITFPDKQLSTLCK